MSSLQTKLRGSQQFQVSIANSGCLYPQCLKHLFEHSKQGMTSIRGEQETFIVH